MVRTAMSASPGAGAADPLRALRSVVVLSAPLLLAVAGAAIVAGLVQTGGVLAVSRLSPDLARLSPARGLRSLLSPERAFLGLRVLLGASVLLALAERRLEAHVGELALSTGRLAAASSAALDLAAGLGRDALLVVAMLGAMDLLVTRRAWWSRLKMTPAEVRREARDLEGDAGQREARARALRSAVAIAPEAALRDAVVVLVGEPDGAVALRYREGEDEAPLVVATGRGDAARRIVEAAGEAGVALVEDSTAVQALARLEVGHRIGTEMYERVGEILGRPGTQT
jgi:flagellar biosynthesis protein FlhB